MTPIHQTLLEILHAKAYDRLQPFKEPSTWSSLRQDERALLALLLTHQGAHELAEGNNEALKTFDMAVAVSNESPEIFYQHAEIFVAYHDSPGCLHLACSAYAKTIQKDPQFFDATYKLALLLLNLGIEYEDISSVNDAINKFEKAASLAPKEMQGEVLWQWGRSWAWLGKLSQEVHDYYKAIDYYKKASEIENFNASEFWIDYGKVLADLGVQFNQADLFREALYCFYRAEASAAHDSPLPFFQACCLNKLGELTGELEYFESAGSKFERASQTDPLDEKIWLEWASMEVGVGRRVNDYKLVENSLEKFKFAFNIDPTNPLILINWSEAELILGSKQGNIEYIHSAKRKVISAIELEPDNHQFWFCYGTCLNELGAYFQDAQFYKESILKFEHGLTLSPDNFQCWYGLAISHLALAEYNESLIMFAKAIECFERAAKGGDLENTQFYNDWAYTLIRKGELAGEEGEVIEGTILLEKILKICSEKEGFFLNEIEWLFNLGYGYYVLGDLMYETEYFEKAVHICNQVLECDPHNLEARRYLAMSLSNIGDFAESVEHYQAAVEHYKRILERDSEDDEIYLECAIAMIEMAKLQTDVHFSQAVANLYISSEQLLQHALALGNQESYYSLAGLYSLTGRLQNAFHYLSKAHLIHPLNIDELNSDEWFDNLRAAPEYDLFISELPHEDFGDKE